MARPMQTCQAGPSKAFDDTDGSVGPQASAFISMAPSASTKDAPAANDLPMELQGPMPRVQPPLDARRRDGSRYEDDLIRDVLEYRALRWRALRGESTTSQDTERFQLLESRLRQAQDDGPQAQLRMFSRFDCEFAGRVIYQGPHGAPIATNVAVQDISAGGVKVSTDQDFEEGERVELVFLIDDESQTVVNLPARVAWKKPGTAGLMFAGPPA